MPALDRCGCGRLGRTQFPSRGSAPDVQPENPLQLRAAIQMAGLFQAVLMAVHLARAMWGQSGVLTSAAILGLTDVDALTVSMATRGCEERLVGVRSAGDRNRRVGKHVVEAGSRGLPGQQPVPGHRQEGTSSVLMIVTAVAALVRDRTLERVTAHERALAALLGDGYVVDSDARHPGCVAPRRGALSVPTILSTGAPSSRWGCTRFVRPSSVRRKTDALFCQSRRGACDNPASVGA